MTATSRIPRKIAMTHPITTPNIGLPLSIGELSEVEPVGSLDVEAASVTMPEVDGEEEEEEVVEEDVVGGTLVGGMVVGVEVVAAVVLGDEAVAVGVSDAMEVVEEACVSAEEVSMGTNWDTVSPDPEPGSIVEGDVFTITDVSDDMTSIDVAPSLEVMDILVEAVEDTLHGGGVAVSLQVFCERIPLGKKIQISKVTKTALPLSMTQTAAAP